MIDRVRVATIISLMAGALLAAEGLVWADDKAAMRRRYHTIRSKRS
jgi:hypothetical protein